MAEPLRLVITVDDKGSPVVKVLAGNVRGLAGELGSKAAPAADKVRQATEAMGRSFSAAVRQAVGLAAAVVGVRAGIGAVGDVVSSMANFEREMANVATLVDTSKVSISGLQAELLKLPPSLGSSKDLAQGLYQALSAGIEPAKAVQFVGEAAKLAKAGLTETKVAVDVLTTALNAYGLQASDTAKISDIFFKTVELGKTTLPELAGAIGGAIPLAAQLGINLTDLSAAIATLTAGGKSTSEAVTGMRSAMSQFIQQTEKFRAVGIDIKQVLSKQGLIGALDALKQATGGNVELVRQFVPDLEGLGAVLSLLGTQYGKLVTTQQALTNSAGATDAAFTKQQATFSALTDRIQNAWDRVVQQAAPAVLAALTTLLTPLEQYLLRLKDSGEAGVQFATTTVSAFQAVSQALNFLGQAVLLVLEGWNRLAHGVGLVVDFVLAGVQKLIEAFKALGLATKQDLADFRAIDQMRLKVLEFAQSSKQAAESYAANGATISAFFASLGAHLDATRDMAARFADTMQKGADDTTAATQKTAQSVAQSNQAIADSAQRTSQGILLFWREGQLQTRDLFRETQAAAQTSTAQVSMAMQRLGAQSTAVLKDMAAKAATDFQTILTSGQVSAQQLATIWTQDIVPKIKAAYGTIPPAFAALDAQMTQMAQQTAASMASSFVDAAEAARLAASRAQAAASEAGKQATESLGQLGQGLATVGKETDKTSQLTNILDTAWKGAFSSMPTTIAGITTQLARMQENIIGLSDRFIGMVGISRDLVEHQTAEYRHGIELLTERLAQLEAQTWDVARATDAFTQAGLGATVMAKDLANAFATLNVKSSLELEGIATRAVKAFRTIEKSGAESAARLQEIFSEAVLPTLQDAFGAGGRLQLPRDLADIGRRVRETEDAPGARLTGVLDRETGRFRGTLLAPDTTPPTRPSAAPSVPVSFSPARLDSLLASRQPRAPAARPSTITQAGERRTAPPAAAPITIGDVNIHGIDPRFFNVRRFIQEIAPEIRAAQRRGEI